MPTILSIVEILSFGVDLFFDKDRHLQVRYANSLELHSLDEVVSVCRGQVLAVQMSSDFTKGVLLPKPELFDMTGNIKYCLQHNPIQYKMW
jgi:hypothetical protein